MKKINFLLFSCFLCFFFSCSSSPKRAMLVTDTSDAAANFYDIANGELVSGQIESAGGHLQQAYNLAMRVDDADLLCRISLSAIIYKLNLKNENLYEIDPVTQLPKMIQDISADTPFYGLSANDLLNLAKTYSSRSNNPDMFSCVCSLYEIRIKLAQNETLDVNSLVSKMKSEEKYLSKEPYYLAFMYRTQGNVYAYDKNYEKAHESYLQSAILHTKERYLNEIGLDYYGAARMSSLNGNKKKALEEIDIALKYDKDAENTVAIAADYFAYGLILLKGECTNDEKQRAKNAILWASSVYNAGGYYEESQNCKKVADSL